MLVNPINFRLSVSIFWNSSWSLYNNVNYKYLFQSDIVFFEIFMFFCKRFVNAGNTDIYVTHIRLYRLKDKTILNIFFHCPLFEEDEIYVESMFDVLLKENKWRTNKMSKKIKVLFSKLNKIMELFILHFYFEKILVKKNFTKYLKNYWNNLVNIYWKRIIQKDLKYNLIFFENYFINIGLYYKNLFLNNLNSLKIVKLQKFYKKMKINQILWDFVTLIFDSNKKSHKKPNNDLIKEILENTSLKNIMNMYFLNKRTLNLDKTLISLNKNEELKIVSNISNKKIQNFKKKKKKISMSWLKSIQVTNKVTELQIIKEILKKMEKNKKYSINKEEYKNKEEKKNKYKEYKKIQNIFCKNIIKIKKKNLYLKVNAKKKEEFYLEKYIENFITLKNYIKKKIKEMGKNVNCKQKIMNYLYTYLNTQILNLYFEEKKIEDTLFFSNKLHIFRSIFFNKLLIYNIYYYCLSKFIKKYTKKKLFKFLNNFQLNLFQVNFNLINASIISTYIKKSLYRRYSIFETLRPVLVDLKKRMEDNKILGFKIIIKGRFKRAQRATYWWRKDGRLLTGTQTSIVDYFSTLFTTKYGVSTISTWLTIGFLDKIEELFYPEPNLFFFFLEEDVVFKIKYFILKTNIIFLNNLQVFEKILESKNYKMFIKWKLYTYLYSYIFLYNMSIEKKNIDQNFFKFFLPQYFIYKIYLEDFVKKNIIKIIPIIPLKIFKRINLRNSYKIKFFNEIKTVDLKVFKYTINLN